MSGTRKHEEKYFQLSWISIFFTGFCDGVFAVDIIPTVETTAVTSAVHLLAL
ncbi:hypothetical protein M405DRAFT_828439 [Rhizopogon salebrosus TDB-379]|nr:hypothetical protein M405DRAFT_828439 [Rhizopogon salebrosus TDB-379]